MANGRAENGQFAPGNKIGKGNTGGRPSKKREERYYEIALNTCSFKDFKAIVQKAVEQAMDGDKDARKWLADYLIGPAPKKLDVTTGGARLVWMDWGDGSADDQDDSAA